jgi:hypothetical protein
MLFSVEEWVCPRRLPAVSRPAVQRETVGLVVAYLALAAAFGVVGAHDVRSIAQLAFVLRMRCSTD